MGTVLGTGMQILFVFYILYYHTVIIDHYMALVSTETPASGVYKRENLTKHFGSNKHHYDPFKAISM